MDIHSIERRLIILGLRKLIKQWIFKLNKYIDSISQTQTEVSFFAAFTFKIRNIIDLHSMKFNICKKLKLEYFSINDIHNSIMVINRGLNVINTD